MSERRDRVVESVLEHIFMDHSFARGVAETYVDSVYPNEEDLSDWLNDDEDDVGRD